MKEYLDEKVTLSMDISEKRRLCNILKMSMFIFCSLIEKFEEREQKKGPSLEAAAEAAVAKGRGKKVTQKKSDETCDWERFRSKGVDLLLNICILPLQRLFTPPIVEEAFVNMTTKCCYKILENQSIAKMDQLKQSVFLVIANAVTKHNHSLNFCLKVIQLLQAKDFLFKDLASLIELMVKNHDQKIIVNELISEIERVDMNKDSPGTRAISEFLREIAERCPDAVLAASSTLIEFLDLDAYLIRNAVLSVIGSVVSLRLSDPEAPEIEKKLRDELLDKLEDHIHDLTTFTRGRAINVWTKLCTEGKIPLSRMDPLVGKIVGRLKDKSVYVRKAAVNFLTEFLKRNPYAGRLSIDELNEKLKKESEKLDQLLAARSDVPSSNGTANGGDHMEVDGNDEEDSQEKSDEGGEPKADSQETEVDPQSTSQNTVASEPVDDAEITAQRKVVTYLSDCVKFTQHIRSAIPLVCSMLNSANISDSQEAIDFFVTAHQFGVREAISGIRSMLLLAFARDKAVQQAVIEAYKQIYLNNSEIESLNHRQKCTHVVKSLMELVEGATIGELLALEEILQHLMASGDIDADHTKILFEKYAMKQPEVTPHQSRVACKLICMLASADKELVIQNLDTFVTIGLGQRANEDSQLVQLTCATLAKAADSNPKVEEMKVAFRLEQTHSIFTRLHQILVDKITNQEDNFYLPMSHEAIKVIYKLAEHPDQICEEMLREMLQIIVPDQTSRDSGKENEETNSNPVSSLAEFADEAPEFDIPSHVLCRFFTIVGNVALNELIFLESSVLTEVKIRKFIVETKESEKQSQKKSRPKGSTVSRRKTMTPGTPGNAEEEIGLAGASAVEDELEQFRIFRLVDDPKNLLSQVAPLVVQVVSHPEIYSDFALKNAATLALAKLMCLSHKFCQTNLRLLFTISNKAEEAIIRQNVIVALGDLCLRYPNLLDQWTPWLYKPLNDPDVNVRKNAIKVLSRLILSDMVKAKGQISEMAKLIVDDDVALSSLAQMFFNEFKKKENAIYNILPDIISHLSGGDEEIDETKFQEILKFFLKMIEKDKHTQCLVEKLCHRFRATINERQWRDLVFCLGQLEYSEKSFLKIYENMSAFADKLSCDAVYEGIMAIIERGRKLPLKAESKEQLVEFEAKVKECRNRGINKEDESEIHKIVGTPPASSKKTPAHGRSVRGSAVKVSTAKKATAKKSTRRGRQKKDESEDEEDRMDVTNKADNPPPSSSRPTRTTRRRIQNLFEDDSE